MMGIEPTTSSLPRKRSTPELHRLGFFQEEQLPPFRQVAFSSRWSQIVATINHHCRAGDEARTRDPQLGRLMLYQLSYSRLINNNCKD